MIKSNKFCKYLGKITGNTIETFDIPLDIFGAGAVYILATSNGYGVGGVWILIVNSSGSDKRVNITTLVPTNYITVESVLGSPSSFKVTTQNVSGFLYITRIA